MYLHFHFKNFDMYVFESQTHFLIRHWLEQRDKADEIELELLKLGSHSNMETQHVLSYNI